MNPDKSNNSIPSKLSRRAFVNTAISALGVSSLLLSPVLMGGTERENKNELTVQQVIDLILKSIPNAPFKETVDTLKSGRADQLVTGIVTTMFATTAVIKKAINLKSNFIIAHEPTFYNHFDDTSWLEQDKVYHFKRKLLTENNIALWRFHDYWHAHQPDGIQFGVLKTLGWEKYYNPENDHIVKIPSTTFEYLLEHIKEKLGIKNLLIIGDTSQVCERIAILPGAVGGKGQIALLQKEQPDVLIIGELQEWETSEYIRDARAMGNKMSLIILGHAVSEEPGMEWLVEWLKPQMPKLNITHVASENPFYLEVTIPGIDIFIFHNLIKQPVSPKL